MLFPHSPSLGVRQGLWLWPIEGKLGVWSGGARQDPLAGRVHMPHLGKEGGTSPGVPRRNYSIPAPSSSRSHSGPRQHGAGSAALLGLAKAGRLGANTG